MDSTSIDMTIAISHVDVISSGVRQFNRTVLIKNGTIIDVVEAGSALPDDTIIHDYSGHILLPGLIDLQIYGAGGNLFGGNPSIAALDCMEVELSRQGVTGFMATMATNTPEVFNKGIESALYKRKNSIGNCWGLHLEGPYLNKAKRGAHPEELIRKPTQNEIELLIQNSSGCIKMMTVAPENIDESILTTMNNAGIILSIGHSNANYEQGKYYFQNSLIHSVTHLFNAMPVLHHRDVGFTLAVLESNTYASIVVDGIHVHYSMVKFAKQQLKQKLFLITDAVTETNEGIYQHISHNNEYYKMPDGTLSGSALTLLKAIYNCVYYCDITLEESVNMATLYPAEVIKCAHIKGKIERGYDADICIINTALQPIATYIAGKRVYCATI